MRAPFAVLVVAVACFSVDYGDGKIPCGPGGLCPNQLRCDGFTSLCVITAGPGSPDASIDLDADLTADADLAVDADTTPDVPTTDANCVLTVGMDSWVDPVNGVDDVFHGAAPGLCAFKTIGYALTHSSKIINLTFATYSSATFPIALMGTQGLDCDPLATTNRATITSNATTGSGLVTFEGTANILRNCILDAQNSTGANCMVIYSTGATPHIINNSEFKNCYNNGVITQNTGNNINISNSSFHDSARGIWWIVANPLGNMNNNTFSSNSFFDIDCQDTAASLQGTNNSNGAGAPTCDQCTNCPFD